MHRNLGKMNVICHYFTQPIHEAKTNNLIIGKNLSKFSSLILCNHFFSKVLPCQNLALYDNIFIMAQQ